MDDQKSRVVSCRVCHSSRLEPILDFGEMPLANRYPSNPWEHEIFLPLNVILCMDCSCVQLGQSVDPKLLFENYLYTSSTSGSLADHFKIYARRTVELIAPPKNAFIVGIGGNDGPLEKAYQELGFKVLNVEASKNIADLSRSNGIRTWNEWFNEDTARAIVGEHGFADIITCNNCFAHMPDIHGAVRAIKALLAVNGTFICENAYWSDAVRGNHFDQIYHEHCFYWTIKALDRLFRDEDMTINAVHFNESQGGSIRVFVKHAAATLRSNWVRCAIEREEALGLFYPETYSVWRNRIADWRLACLDFLSPLDSICCYGVPAKFTMVAEQLRFNAKRIDYAVEDSPIKVGRYTPGSRVPIVNWEHFEANPTDHCIITATNYAKLIMSSNPQYKGKWIVLTPEPRFL